MLTCSASLLNRTLIKEIKYRHGLHEQDWIRLLKQLKHAHIYPSLHLQKKTSSPHMYQVEWHFFENEIHKSVENLPSFFKKRLLGKLKAYWHVVPEQTHFNYFSHMDFQLIDSPLWHTIVIGKVRIEYLEKEDEILFGGHIFKHVEFQSRHFNTCTINQEQDKLIFIQT